MSGLTRSGTPARNIAGECVRTPLRHRKVNDTQILIVEDDPDISTPLAAFLAGKGYTMHVAGSVEAADRTLAAMTSPISSSHFSLGERPQTPCVCRPLMPINASRMFALVPAGTSSSRAFFLFPFLLFNPTELPSALKPDCRLEMMRSQQEHETSHYVP